MVVQIHNRDFFITCLLFFNSNRALQITIGDLGMKPTYEELENDLKETQKLLKIALERIIKLEEQINKNSKNSSKPPSSAGLAHEEISLHPSSIA